jgi:hypothetical protein
MSARSALMKHHANLLPKRRKSSGKRKNQKPEADLKKLVMAWLKSNRFLCNAVESKAVYSHSAGRYISGQTDAGFSDIVGTSPFGQAVFIELKAPGRRGTLKEHQREFLLDRISCGAFAVCIDSVEDLAKVWDEWHKASDRSFAKNLLANHLPVEKSRVSVTLFEE